MSLPAFLSVVLFACLALSLAGACRRVVLWRRGRAAPVPFFAGLAALPKRYLVDLHHVVARDRYSANMHVAVAGGLVGALGLIALAHLPWPAWRAALPWIVLAVLVLMLAGAAAAILRRRFHPKARTGQLSGGAWRRLSWTLGGFALGCLYFTISLLRGQGIPEADLFGWLATLLIALGFAEVFVGAGWGGPMKHAFAGALHLAFHPRPERFQPGRIDSGLKVLDLAAHKLGVEAPADFAWNRLLGFDACVQCGRCEVACPAFAAGQPLNPKKLVQDLVTGFSAAASDARYAGRPHPGRPHPGQPHPGQAGGVLFGGAASAIVPDLISPETLWACTTCRACVQECPMMIEHVDAVIDLRRFQTLEKGATPGKGPELLEELRLTGSSAGLDLASRLDWAADLSLPLMSPAGDTDVLLWLGEGAFNLRNQRTLRALVKLLRAAGIDFAVLGAEELDVGDIARRLGDEATFQELARRNIATLARYRFKRIVTADPHVFHCLKNEYPALGGHYDVRHHTGLLADLQAEGRLRLKADPRLGKITYHDPCYLARYNGETTAPRGLLGALGVEVAEMARSGMTARCCGGGGGAPVTDIPGERRIPDMRMADAKQTGAGVVAVACPNCMVMLEGVVEPRPAVRDIAELLAEALVEEGQ